MVERIFSKNILIITLIVSSLLLTGAILGFVYFFPKGILQKNSAESSPGSEALNFSLRNKLIKKIDQSLAIYPEKGWEEAREALEEVRLACKKHCDPEVFFNESLDSLADTLTTNQEFVSAASILGILYPGNWELSDVDGDQENEMIILQRDALNADYIIFKVIDFQENPKVASFKLEGFGYFGSPNSSGTAPAPIKVLDLTGDIIPEIILFLSSGRGGARLFVFQYRLGRLKLIFKKDDLFYPEYTFADFDKDQILEVEVEGYRPEKGIKIKEILDLHSQY